MKLTKATGEGCVREGDGDGENEGVRELVKQMTALAEMKAMAMAMVITCGGA